MEPSYSLSIGQVSGLIALGTAVVAFTAPLLIGILLLSHYDATRSAATWSVIARQLQSSAWPSLLGTDSTAGRNVAWSVSAASYLNLGLAFLTILAGIITPLGLSDTITTAGDQMVEFVYLRDLSTFGRSAQRRPDMPLSRDCAIQSFSCPGAVIPDAVFNQGKANVSANATITSTTRIPENITTMFSSATKNSTVAGIFDIQYRFWKRNTNKYFDNQQPYVKGVYRPVETLLSRGNLTLAEGIIADFDSGGIGFRNHTGPSGLDLGGEWDEDILWIEPEISCVKTNLSFELTLDESPSGSASVSRFELVDEGGFSLLRTGDPYKSWPNITYSNPDVRLRADRSAWLYDVLSASVLNLTELAAVRRGAKLTNVTLGNHYPLNPNLTFARTLFPPGVANEYLNPTWLELPRATMELNGSIITGGRTLYPPEDHSYEWASALFGELGRRCTGQYDGFSDDIDHNVECGAFLTMLSRIDGGSPLEEENGSRWKTSLLVCAGAVKASVKTVSLSMNASASLGNLVATRVRDKDYADDSSYPLWAIEDWWYPGSEGAYTAPLWGIVHDSYEGTKGYNFTRAPALYLPYSNWIVTWDAPLDSLAGPVAPYAILGQVLSGIFDPILDTPRLPRYDGTDSLALRSKWTSLSETREGSERLLRLVWTDMMASTAIGVSTVRDSSSLEGSDTSANTSRMVTLYARRIVYDMRYAIPALLLLAIWILVILAAIMTGFSHRNLITHLKQLLNDTSVGRVAAITAYPATQDYLRSPTSEWLTAVGHVMLQLGGSKLGGSNTEGYEGHELERLSAKDDNKQGGPSPSEPLL